MEAAKMDKGYINYSADSSGDLYMLHYGIKQCKSAELCGPMMRNMYLLHYVIKGCGRYCDERNEYSIKSGQVFAIYPDDIVSYQADEREPWLFCWVGFGGGKAAEYYDKIGVSRDLPVLRINNDSFLETVKNCLDYTEKNIDCLSQLRLTGYLYEALSCMENNGSAMQELSSAQARVNAAMMYMEYNYDKKIFASDVAKYVGLEYSYFYRLFKKEMGITPEHYLINLRIEKTKKLIGKGYAFKEVPSLVGIGNIYYFTKLFKQITGMTPSEYRDRIDT